MTAVSYTHLYHSFAHYGPWAGPLRRRENGVLIVQQSCETVTYGLNGLQERGRLCVGPQEPVYAGQIVGLHSRSNDLVVNPGRRKQLTNFRNTGHDENYRLSPPLRFTLEEALELIAEDELVEVTPTAIRLRKRTLDHAQRQREDKQAKAPA